MDEGFESTQLHILTITFSSSPILWMETCEAYFDMK